MRILAFFCFLLISGFLSGQNKIYATYQTETGMGIHLTTDTIPPDEIQVRLTAQEYEFIDPFYLPETAISPGKVYVRFRECGKMGILNMKGKVVIPAIFDTIERCERWAGEAMPLIPDFFILRKERCAWVKRMSDLQDFFQQSYDSVFYDYFLGDLRCFEKDRVRYFCNNGRELFPKICFESISQVYPPEEYFWNKEHKIPLKMIAKEAGKPMSVYSTVRDESFENLEEATLIRFLPEMEADTFRLLVFASKNGKMGLLDECGNIRVPFEFDSLIPLDEWYRGYGVNRLITIRNGKEGLSDFRNRCIYPPAYLQGSFTENESYYNDTLFIVSKDTSTVQGVLDIHGHELIPVAEQTIKEHIHNGYYNQQFFVITRKGKTGVYDFEGKEVIPCRYSSVYDENAVNDYAEEPHFITFNSEEERYNYWILR